MTEADPAAVYPGVTTGEAPGVHVPEPGLIVAHTEPDPTVAEALADQTVPHMDFDGVAAEVEGPEGKTRRERRKQAKKDREPRSFWLELPVLLVLGIVVVILLKSFVLQAFFIPSGSMEDTLEINDRVLVNRQAYLFGEPERGDVIVFRNWEEVGEEVPSPSVWEYIVRSLKEGIGLDGNPRGQDLIKRVIAVPGDTVEVRDSRVFINGEYLKEPYILVNGADQLADFGPVVVPDGKYFVMGDHRNNSADSRRTEDGMFVDSDAIVGKAFVRIWPFSRMGGLNAPRPLQQDSKG